MKVHVAMCIINASSFIGDLITIWHINVNCLFSHIDVGYKLRGRGWLGHPGGVIGESGETEGVEGRGLRDT